MRIFILALCLILSACATRQSDPVANDDEQTSTSQDELEHTGLGASELAKRVLMSRKECQTLNGQEVGDIGDGRIHQADYLCADGQPPLGTIISGDDQPIAIEGMVCCGAAK